MAVKSVVGSRQGGRTHELEWKGLGAMLALAIGALVLIGRLSLNSAE